MTLFRSVWCAQREMKAKVSGMTDVPDVPATAARLPVAVDIVALTVADGRLCVLLATRGLPPYSGQLCLPGGFMLAGETLAEAALRELAEETGLDATGHLEQLRTFGPQGRDPRGPVVSVAYLMLTPSPGPVRSGGDVQAVQWTPVAQVPPLAFDHDDILAAGVERARAKLEYSGLATAFCASVFTIPELRAVYEAVWGVALDPRNFHRKVTSTPGFLTPVATRQGQAGRPAVTYRLVPGREPAAVVLNPPVMRP